MALRKPTVEHLDGEVTRGLVEGAVFRNRPHLAEFMVEGKYEDGTDRVRPTVMAFISDGQWQLWLHDREEGRGAFASGRTLDEALSALETGLKAASLCWRKDGGNKKK